MRFAVDLKVCQDHGQCAYAARAFSLTADGRLAFRQQSADVYESADVGEDERDDIEEAADSCPVQAIEIRD
ncbi:ferredoxin [Streptomyces sp. NPDC058067]|uniref:ferredoxin n=1 Tax=Streptomyces sp. NPDC058067 TaxID=3346324 RepID=UPI0036E36B5E